MMKSLKLDRLTSFLLLGFFFLFILFAFRIGVEYRAVSIIVFFFFILLIMGLTVYKKKNIKNRIKTLIPFLIFQMFYFFSFDPDVPWIIYQPLMVLFSFLIANLRWEKKQLKYFAIIAHLFLFFLVVRVNETQSVISLEEVSNNTYGVLAFLLSFFPTLYYIKYSNKYTPAGYIIILLLNIKIHNLTNTRSIILGISFTVLTYLLWGVISKNKTFFNFYFLTLVIFVFLFTIIYPNLDTYLGSFQKLNNLIIELTGKRILSGRNEIWNFLILLIKEKPFFGYGAGVSLNTFFDTTLSAHNLYLQIALQVGILGLVCFVVFLFLLWRQFWNNRNRKVIRFSASFFIGILIYQTLEVSLLQNNFSLSLIQWFIIGLSLSMSYEKSVVE